MGFKSVMKKIGKVALKVAPIAAAFIPGIGIPLSMAISGAANAASTKLSGGTWGQAALSGGIGAGLGAVGAGAAKGIGPTSSALSKFAAGSGGKVAGTGVIGALGQAASQVGTSAAMGALGGGGGSTVPTYSRGNESNTSTNSNTGLGPSAGMAPGFSYSANNPNLESALSYGAKLGKMNQPFRAGYDVNYPGIPAFGNQPAIPSETRSMPPIFSPNLKYNIPGQNQRRRGFAAQLSSGSADQSKVSSGV